MIYFNQYRYLFDRCEAGYRDIFFRAVMLISDMKTLSALLAFCDGNPSGPKWGALMLSLMLARAGCFTNSWVVDDLGRHDSHVTRKFDVFFDLHLNKRLVIWDAITLIMTSL